YRHLRPKKSALCSPSTQTPRLPLLRPRRKNRKTLQKNRRNNRPTNLGSDLNWYALIGSQTLRRSKSGSWKQSWRNTKRYLQTNSGLQLNLKKIGFEFPFTQAQNARLRLAIPTD